MRTAPSIVPHGGDHDTYIVLDDFGHLGRCWRETDADADDRQIRDLVEGQYKNPVRIVAFNTAEGWSRDVTIEIAEELRRRSFEFGNLPNATLDFMESHRR